jgi:hypothetical protein
MGKFKALKKMWQVGDKSFPAANAAEALQVQKAMEAKGMIQPGKVLVEAEGATPVANKPLSNLARGAAIPGMSSGMDVLGSGVNDLKEGFQMYRDRIANPIAEKLKKTLTPDVQVGDKTYQTSSAVTDMGMDIMGDPLTYAGGGAGMALGAMDAATSLGEEAPKRNFDALKHILQKK